MAVHIVTDSGISLPLKIIKERQITVVAGTITIDGDTLRDYPDLSPADFYRRLKQAKTLPIMRDSGVRDFMVAYRQIIQQDPSAAILSIHVAESLATTIGSARQAAAAFPNHDIRLVDCQSVSLGQGLIVHEAARMIAEAMSLNATVERLKVIRDRLSVYVVLDTLQYLARGGRVRTSQQLIADFLNIKPILSVQSGEVKPFSQERNRERALDRLYELAREACQKQPDVVMACMHADCEADMHRMTARVRQDINPAVVLQGEICPAVGVQTGPGALGLAWITEAEHVATRLQETRTSAIMDVLR